MNKNDKHIYISVFLYKQGFTPAGVITFNESLGYSGFSYFKSYMEKNYPPLNPATLNWRDGDQRHFIVNHQQNHQMLDRTFWEMLPGQNDWGNHILISRYPEYAQLNNAQKLYFLNSRKVGGLSSYIKEQTEETNIQGADWLDKIRSESIDFYLKNLDKISYIKAINPMTSYGGARPKCMFEDENGDFWVAKFNLPNDPYDMAIAEHTALEMAKDMGLNCAESKILTLDSGENVFLSKRFDRDGEKRFHSLSLFALAQGNDIIKRNPSAPGNPGGYLKKLVERYSDFENMDTVNILIKLLVDIGINNTDNHLRNTRIILNQNNKWQLSPVYDILFNPYSQVHTYNPASLPLSELYLTNNELPEALSKELGIDINLIKNKIDKLMNVLQNWESYCDKNKMSATDKIKIGKAITLGTSRKDYSPKIIVEAPKNKIIPRLVPKNN